VAPCLDISDFRTYSQLHNSLLYFTAASHDLLLYSLLPGLGEVFPPIQPQNSAIWQKIPLFFWLFVVLVLGTKTSSFCAIFAE
jgi:hypothetical protein